MVIEPFEPGDRERCAQLLVDEFRDTAPEAWPELGKARETVDECLAEGPVLVARDGDVVAWVGARPAYARVWELHPMVVARGSQRRGIGRALIAAIERVAATRGALTMTLGSDD